MTSLSFDSPIDSSGRWRDYFRTTTIGIALVHVLAIVGVIGFGVSLSGVGLALAAYYVRMVAVTAGYHRYFAHRSFKTSRWFQFLLALATQSAAQRGVIWWASLHRWHHKHSDTALDMHSAAQRGFWYAHYGWILNPTWTDTEQAGVADLARFPELRALNHTVIGQLPALALAGAFYWFGGLFGLVWGFCVSNVLLWHASFAINSLAHLIGRQRYDTGDESRNSLLLALLTTGEGWHNNHHHYQSSARQGFRWWQIDLTYYVLRLLAAVGLVWDVREPPRHIVDSPRPKALAAVDHPAP